MTGDNRDDNSQGFLSGRGLASQDPRSSETRLIFIRADLVTLPRQCGVGCGVNPEHTGSAYQMCCRPIRQQPEPVFGRLPHAFTFSKGPPIGSSVLGHGPPLSPFAHGGRAALSISSEKDSRCFIYVHPVSVLASSVVLKARG